MVVVVVAPACRSGRLTAVVAAAGEACRQCHPVVVEAAVAVEACLLCHQKEVVAGEPEEDPPCYQTVLVEGLVAAEERLEAPSVSPAAVVVLREPAVRWTGAMAADRQREHGVG